MSSKNYEESVLPPRLRCAIRLMYIVCSMSKGYVIVICYVFHVPKNKPNNSCCKQYVYNETSTKIVSKIGPPLI